MKEAIKEYFGNGRVQYTCPETKKSKLMYHCEDCDFPQWDIYMVKDHIWKEGMGRYQGILCMFCLEKRLNRQLIPDDFTSAPCNDMIKIWYQRGTLKYEATDELGRIK